MTILTVVTGRVIVILWWGGAGFSAELSRGRDRAAVAPGASPLSHYLLLWNITARSTCENKQAPSGRREFSAGRANKLRLFRSAYFAGAAGNGGVHAPILTFPSSTTLAGSARTAGNSGVHAPIRTAPLYSIAGVGIFTVLVSFTVLSNI
jgi:hypothetical protein